MTLSSRRGAALLVMIVVVLIVEGVIAVTLLVAATRARLAADQRWAVEGELVAKSALAEARVHFATGAVLPEGIPQHLVMTRTDGWRWSVVATRAGDLVRMAATVQRFGADGVPIAGSRATLLLRRLMTDTLQRLPSHTRF